MVTKSRSTRQEAQDKKAALSFCPKVTIMAHMFMFCLLRYPNLCSLQLFFADTSSYKTHQLEEALSDLVIATKLARGSLKDSRRLQYAISLNSTVSSTRQFNSQHFSYSNISCEYTTGCGVFDSSL